MENQSNSQSLQVTDSLTFPQVSRLLPHQQQVLLQSHQRYKVLVWHRRARKTTTAVTELVKQAHLRVGVYWHVFPTYGEAKNAVWRDPQMLFNIIPEQLILKKNEQELVVYFKNGSILQLIGADKPQRLLGAGPVGVVLDEFAEMKYEMWDRIISPILTANGGWCWFIGTPRGKNHLYTLYTLGQQNNPEWKSWLLKASQSGIIPAEALENARETMTQAHWNQEWECEFLEGEGSVFRGVKDVMTAVPHGPLSGHIYVMGVDLAKVKDWTTIRVYDRATNAQVYTDRFQTLEWPFQKKKIKSVSDHYNNALTIIDATGLGDPIADDLIRAGVPVEPIKITEQIKKELIEKLSIYIEQKKIRLLPSDDALLEYDNFSYEIGPTGKIRYGGRQGFNDDIVLGDALAVWSLPPLYIEKRDKELTPLQAEYQAALRQSEEGDDDEREWQQWAQEA